jgi:hypothetical protein
MGDVPDVHDTQAVLLRRLREPFPPETIGKLPRVTCGDCSKKQCQRHQRARCNVCQAYVSTQHIHLDFVGHAAITDRLLNVDLRWRWDPIAYDDRGAPLLERDSKGNPVGMWIVLTVAGMSRIGYGSVEPGKPDPQKELIGDALRNAGMRFGMALELWHKGDLPHDDAQEPEPSPQVPADPRTLAELMAEAAELGVPHDYPKLEKWARQSDANMAKAMTTLRNEISEAAGTGEGPAVSENVPLPDSPVPVAAAGRGGADPMQAAPPAPATPTTPKR